jgi:hypothetical protein
LSRVQKPHDSRKRPSACLPPAPSRNEAAAGSSSEQMKPVIQLELFHDTVAGLKTMSVGFEVLSGTTVDQARRLVELMNERIVGVIVTPK